MDWWEDSTQYSTVPVEELKPGDVVYSPLSASDAVVCSTEPTDKGTKLVLAPTHDLTGRFKRVVFSAASTLLRFEVAPKNSIPLRTIETGNPTPTVNFRVFPGAGIAMLVNDGEKTVTVHLTRDKVRAAAAQLAESDRLLDPEESPTGETGA